MERRRKIRGIKNKGRMTVNESVCSSDGASPIPDPRRRRLQPLNLLDIRDWFAVIIPYSSNITNAIGKPFSQST